MGWSRWSTICGPPGRHTDSPVSSDGDREEFKLLHLFGWGKKMEKKREKKKTQHPQREEIRVREVTGDSTGEEEGGRREQADQILWLTSPFHGALK